MTQSLAQYFLVLEEFLQIYTYKWWNLTDPLIKKKTLLFLLYFIYSKYSSTKLDINGLVDQP